MESIIKELREKRGERVIEHGDKVIKIEVHFWINDLAEGKEKCIPKVAWDFGTVHILKNMGMELTEANQYTTVNYLNCKRQLRELWREEYA